MRIQRILIGLDFSSPATAAAKWAAEQLAPGAELVLAHVIELPPAPAFVKHVLPSADEIESALREHAVTRLHEVASFLTSAAPRLEVRTGKPHEVLATLARETNADLVVIGPHGDRARPWISLGTTAERLVRSSPVPVLVGANPPAATLRRLLVPVDDADITTTVLAWARDVAQERDADVTLLHVLSNAVYSYVASLAYATTADSSAAGDEIRAELRDEGIRWLEELARTGIQRERVTSAVTYGDAGEAIVTMAASMHADLIVVGRRGSGVVAPALLGSTVGSVLRGAPCPVLVVAEPTKGVAGTV